MTDRGGSSDQDPTGARDRVRSEIEPVVAERVVHTPDLANHSDEITEIAIDAAEQVMISWSSHKGPLPPPAILAAYDQIVPGAAEELMSLIVKEQQHRHDWETTALEKTSGERRRRDWLAAGVAGTALTVTAAIALWLNSPWAGIVGIAIVTLGGGALLLGRGLLVDSEHGSFAVGQDGETAESSGEETKKTTQSQPKKKAQRSRRRR